MTDLPDPPKIVRVEWAIVSLSDPHRWFRAGVTTMYEDATTEPPPEVNAAIAQQSELLDGELPPDDLTYYWNTEAPPVRVQR